MNEAEAFWEEHYRGRSDGGAVHPNPVLEQTAGTMPPGDALDLGCGAGGDTIWLARQGWRVTAVDIADTAVQRVRALSRQLGVEGRVTAERHDLTDSFPDGRFDLISAHYLHTPYALDRARVLRTAAGALRTHGHLLIVDHGSTMPWSWKQTGAHHPTPDEVAAELALDPARWSVVRADRPHREATGPSGRTATVIDNVLLVRRIEGAG
jgi:SAM-dependent methyltransferase